MIPVLQPGELGQELYACAALGAVIGTGRVVFPIRGHKAFLPDLLAVGSVLFAVQSYAAGQSSAGVLRWYMLAAAFAGAAAAASLLGVPLRAAGNGMSAAGQRLHHFLCRKAAPLRRKLRGGSKTRRSGKRNEEKSKKNLPKNRLVLYNSNVSE